jgi:hypothetical protein
MRITRLGRLFEGLLLVGHRAACTLTEWAHEAQPRGVCRAVVVTAQLLRGGAPPRCFGERWASLPRALSRAAGLGLVAGGRAPPWR